MINISNAFSCLLLWGDLWTRIYRKTATPEKQLIKLSIQEICVSSGARRRLRHFSCSFGGVREWYYCEFSENFRFRIENDSIFNLQLRLRRTRSKINSTILSDRNSSLKFQHSRNHCKLTARDCSSECFVLNRASKIHGTDPETSEVLSGEEINLFTMFEVSEWIPNSRKITNNKINCHRDFFVHLGTA